MNMHRSASLSASQEVCLQQLTAFLDKHLLGASKEKRSVALHLTTVLVQRCPADCIPLALSPVFTVFILHLSIRFYVLCSISIRKLVGSIVVIRLYDGLYFFAV